MTIATFSNNDPAEQVTLSTAPGAPDVLSLLTTNIPQVHARLVELRARADHPQNRPREVWIDLAGCTNFSETRGEVLVRALRLTQFLPCGFIGTGPAVADMARTANLRRVDDRSHLPRIAAPTPSAVPRAEIEQREDILADMGRRLLDLQEENAAQTNRANVLSQALDVVRNTRDSLEGEIRELNARITRLSGELEWSKIQGSSAEGEVANLMARISQANAAREEASARAAALDDGMQLVEQALVESRKEVYTLQLRLQEMEDNAVPQQDLVSLSESLSQARQRSDDLANQLAQREEDFAAQRAEFLAANETLRTQVGELSASLASSRQEISQQRENMALLVIARDEVERQSVLTAQMLEDALAKVEDLTNQSTELAAQVEQYQTHWAGLNEDYTRTREQLLAAQKEANEANQDLVAASALAEARATQIGQLVDESALKSEALEDARLEANSLRDALDLARHSVQEAEQALEVARQEALDAENALVGFRADLASKETLLAEITTARAQTMDRCRDLETTLAAQQRDTAALAEQVESLRGELGEAQSALLDASAEVAQLQSHLDESRRANGVLEDLAKRTGVELTNARAESEDLNTRLGHTTEQLSEVRASLLEANRREQEAAAETDRRLAVAKAEAESLSRRMAAAQEEAESTSLQMQSVIEDLRAALARQEAVSEETSQALSASRRELEASRAEVVSLSAALVRVQGQLAAAEGALVEARDTIRSCESTIVEQQGRIETLGGELDAGRIEVSGLREQATVSDATIRRQQDQIESGRQTIAHVSGALQQEQQAHSATRAECESATAEVTRLSATVNAQSIEIGEISTELVRVRGVCEEQVNQLSAADAHAAEVERAARNDRRQRAQLETELVDTQEQLAILREAKNLPAPAPVIIEVPVAAPSSRGPLVNHRDRVRSGQVVTSEGDLVVLKAVSSSAELRAVGSVHIYGQMGGRVHAGCQGDTEARIYCSNFFAEQVAIAGRTVNFETIPETLRGHSVEIWLWQDEIKIRAADME